MIPTRITTAILVIFAVGCNSGTRTVDLAKDTTLATDIPVDIDRRTLETTAPDQTGRPAPDFVCASCATHDECGGENDICVALDSHGGFCGMACQDHLCPDGFICDQVPPAADGVVGIPWQCVPMTGSCCGPERAGMVTVCHHTNEWGTCDGTRLCLATTGWTACSAVVPKEDICNGVDDNCDGITDAYFPDADMDGYADCIDIDLDNDGVDDPEDNCIGIHNPGQEDMDGDGIGDPCDQDADNDGWPDWQDCAPGDPNSYPGADEVEDGVDNNCNGTVDEAPGEAGTCGDGCFDMSSGPGGAADFDMEQEAITGVAENEKGYLVLGQGALTYPSIWIANSGEGTVSRLDTETGQEKGRYTVCADPSRTAVDLMGDVWVACRGDGGVAKITLVEANCVDLNDNGTIETSHDNDGDGVIGAGEMLPAGQDECIRFIVFPGGNLQRAAGVDAENHAWIGAWYDQKLMRLSPEEGLKVQEISIPVQPYGLVIDGDGIIWVSGRGGGQLVRVDPATEDVQSFHPSQGGVTGAFEPYGISLDGQGRIWLASCCSQHRVFRYSPLTGQWATVSTDARPRGLVGHLNGRVYTAIDQTNQVAIIGADTMTLLDYVFLGDNRFPVGMSVDSMEQVWAVNQNGATATRIDPETNQITGEFPVGTGPYTYSDMTGYVLYTFTSPLGYYFQTFCAPPDTPIQWTELNAQMALPEGTTIQVRVRSAANPDALENTAWTAPFDPFPGEPLPMDLIAVPALDQTCLQAEFLLFPNDSSESPMLKGISAKYQALP